MATARPFIAGGLKSQTYSWIGAADGIGPSRGTIRPIECLVWRSKFFSIDKYLPRRRYHSSATGRDLYLDTVVLAITGPGTAFGDGRTPPMRFNDLPAHVILLVESRASGIPWPAPVNFDIRTMPQTINSPDGKGISGRYAGGFTVLFGDGSVWFLSDKVPFETLKQFFTVADARKHDREKLLGPYALDRLPSEWAVSTKTGR